MPPRGRFHRRKLTPDITSNSSGSAYNGVMVILGLVSLCVRLVFRSVATITLSLAHLMAVALALFRQLFVLHWHYCASSIISRSLFFSVKLASSPWLFLFRVSIHKLCTSMYFVLHTSSSPHLLLLCFNLILFLQVHTLITSLHHFFPLLVHRVVKSQTTFSELKSPTKHKQKRQQTRHFSPSRLD